MTTKDFDDPLIYYHYKTVAYLNWCVVGYFLFELGRQQFQLHFFPYWGQISADASLGNYWNQAGLFVLIVGLMMLSVGCFQVSSYNHRNIYVVAADIAWATSLVLAFVYLPAELPWMTWVATVGAVWAINQLASATRNEKLRLAKEEQEKCSAADRQVVRSQSNEITRPFNSVDTVPLTYVAKYSKKTFHDIFGMDATKKRLFDAGMEVLKSKNGKSDRNGILLFGAPGNGKTHFVECLAGELNLPLISLTYGDVASQWVNRTTENLMTVFKDAYQQAPCILLLDEIDSFIRSRDQGHQGDESLKSTNTILTELVKLRTRGILVVGATNYLDRLDAAATREGRFDIKVEISPPDCDARVSLLLTSIVNNVKNVEFDVDAAMRLAERWNGFSVKRIQAVTEELAVMHKEKDIELIDRDHLLQALRRVQGRSGRLPENTKALSDLVFDQKLETQLRGIATRILNAEKIEELGGTLPSGLLFFGPPGTGKTETARALAKETRYAFLPCTGNDLIHDSTKLDKLMTEAKDIRPCIVFIDEADDVLLDRNYSNVASITNKLLTAMDGSEEKVKDIVFIAATNNPDRIDPAALRGGRFTEKFNFSYPSVETLTKFIHAWMHSSPAEFHKELSATQIVSVMGAEIAIANAVAILQETVNQMIIRCAVSGQYCVELCDVEEAKSLVSN